MSHHMDLTHVAHMISMPKPDSARSDSVIWDNSESATRTAPELTEEGQNREGLWTTQGYTPWFRWVWTIQWSGVLK
jgi:hypothetical protein